jgi:hypothetical protein
VNDDERVMLPYMIFQDNDFYEFNLECRPTTFTIVYYPHRPSPFIIANHQLSGFITIGIR